MSAALAQPAAAGPDGGRGAGKSAAAMRAGSASMMERRSAADIAAQREISSIVRPQPTQSRAAGSMTQT